MIEGIMNTLKKKLGALLNSNLIIIPEQNDDSVFHFTSTGFSKLKDTSHVRYYCSFKAENF